MSTRTPSPREIRVKPPPSQPVSGWEFVRQMAQKRVNLSMRTHNLAINTLHSMSRYGWLLLWRGRG
ncbi:hypothetical protein BD310DRAFT_914512 [Dichomitus squalens]|uniref:Uncharacterized protein n=1 Tax=Dichomitus squalens TaxID=114155 RepID=A0A4Q9Q9R1_9APHY|nr:hypothetical protein BD310DRAFT_914512 [Dichomitus squalens]